MNVPNIPIIPGMNIPKIPNIGGGTVPNIPNIPNIGGNVPKVPTIPGIPNISQPNVPQVQVFKPKETKPVYVPKNKLRGLNWNKLLLMPKEAPEKVNNIWDDIKEYDVDKEDVENHFKLEKTENQEDNNKQIKTTKLEPTKKRVLDGKRIQKVAISISKIPLPELVSKSLKKMDDLMDRNAISSLLGVLLNETELSAIEVFQTEDPKVQFEKEETLLLKYEQIPDLRKKLEIWQFIFDFEENMIVHRVAIECLETSVKEIRESKILIKLLRVVLAIGNILNGNTNKGRADGFNLDLLTKLSSVKDNNNRPLTHYVITIIQKDDPNFTSMNKYFPNVCDTIKYSLADATSYISKSKKDVEKFTGIIEKLPEDEFKKKAIANYSKIKDEVTSVEKRLQDFNEAFKKLAYNFGLTDKDKIAKNPEEFMALMNSIINEFEKNFPKEEAKKNFNRAHKIGAKVFDNSNTKAPEIKDGKSNDKETKINKEVKESSEIKDSNTKMNEEKNDINVNNISNVQPNSKDLQKKLGDNLANLIKNSLQKK